MSSSSFYGRRFDRLHRRGRRRLKWFRELVSGIKRGRAGGVLGEALLLPLPQGPQVPQPPQWHPYEVQNRILQVWLTDNQNFFLSNVSETVKNPFSLTISGSRHNLLYIY